MSLIIPQLEKPLIRMRFSSLCRVQCFHVSHLLVPEKVHYTGLSVQHHHRFIQLKVKSTKILGTIFALVN